MMRSDLAKKALANCRAIVCRLRWYQRLVVTAVCVFALMVVAGWCIDTLRYLLYGHTAMMFAVLMIAVNVLLSWDQLRRWNQKGPARRSGKEQGPAPKEPERRKSIRDIAEEFAHAVAPDVELSEIEDDELDLDEDPAV